MFTRGISLSAAVLVLALAAPRLASAQNAHQVGLGVAAGLAYSNTELDNASESIGGRFAWGFFVDIPLLSTFYITPATMLYDLDHNGVTTKVTDVDLQLQVYRAHGRLTLGCRTYGRPRVRHSAELRAALRPARFRRLQFGGESRCIRIGTVQEAHSRGHVG